MRTLICNSNHLKMERVRDGIPDIFLALFPPFHCSKHTFPVGYLRVFLHDWMHCRPIPEEPCAHMTDLPIPWACLRNHHCWLPFHWIVCVLSVSCFNLRGCFDCVEVNWSDLLSHKCTVALRLVSFWVAMPTFLDGGDLLMRWLCSTLITAFAIFWVSLSSSVKPNYRRPFPPHNIERMLLHLYFLQHKWFYFS